MRRRRTRAGLLSAALLIGGIAEASATCKESDVAGTWRVAADVTEVGSSYQVKCNIEIDDNGDFSIGDCVGPDHQRITMTEGWVRVIGASCKFTGAFKLNDTRNRIHRANLSDDGATAKGEGSFDGGTFAFTMRRS